MAQSAQSWRDRWGKAPQERIRIAADGSMSACLALEIDSQDRLRRPPLLSPSMDFVPLNRQFLSLPKRYFYRDSISKLELGPVDFPRLYWKDLFRVPRVVILGEAGAGKTREARRAVEMLVERGNFALFVEMQALAAQGLEDAAEGFRAPEFLQWRQSTAPGWFVVDSLDEAKLRNHTLRDALRQLRRALAGAELKAHVVLTSRASDWRAEADLRDFEEIFPFRFRSPDDPDGLELQGDLFDDSQRQRAGWTALSDKLHARSGEQVEAPVHAGYPEGELGGTLPSLSYSDEGDRETLVVRLCDLDAGQIRRFAAACGVTDVASFLAELQIRNAMSFAARPLDLDRLARFWRDHNRLGSLTELVEHSIAENLNEWNPDREHRLSTASSAFRRMAELLAGCLTFADTESFAISDLPTRGKMPTRIHLREIDFGVSGASRAEFIRLPIFDPTSYGLGRFHHRSVREYLCACWLRRLLELGSRREIEGELFRDSYGETVIPVSRQAVVAWLAGMDDRIRDRVLRVAPELLLAEGDVTVLPRDVRAAMLDTYLQKFADEQYTAYPLDPEAVARLAQSDIADDLHRHLARYSDHEGCVELILAIIREGRMTTSAQEVLEIVCNPGAPIRTRARAARALAVTGSIGERRHAVDVLLADRASLHERMAWELIIEFYPDAIDAAQMRRLLEFVDPGPVDELFADTFDDLHASMRELPTQPLRSLLFIFVELLRSPPLAATDRGRGVSDRYGWLIWPLTVGVRELLERSAPKCPVDDLVADCIELAFLDCRFIGDQYVELLRIDTSSDAELRRALFWRYADRMRSANPVPDEFHLEPLDESLPDALDVRLPERFYLEDEDVHWLLTDAQSAPDMRHRRIALYELWGLLRISALRNESAGESWEVAVESMLRTEPSIQVMLEEVKRYDSDRARAIQDERRADDAAATQKEDEQRVRMRAALESVRAGSDTGSLAELRTYPGRQSLAAKFGDDVAEAACTGFTLAWRKHEPPAFSDALLDGQSPDVVVVGLHGLLTEFRETRRWPETLTAAEAARAARYALHDKEGFPPWFTPLADRWPEAVDQVVEQAIREEFALPPGTGEPYVLSALCSGTPLVRESRAAAFLRCLEGSDCLRDDTWRFAIELLCTLQSISDPQRIEIARRRYNAAPNLSAGRLRWLALWVLLEPERALPALDQELAGRSGQDADAAFAQVARDLMGTGESSCDARVDALLRSPHVVHLAALAVKHLPFEPDSELASDSEYELSDIGTQLLWALADLPGESGYWLLHGLSTDTRFQSVKAFLAKRTESRRIAAAEPKAWTARETSQFNARFTIEPADEQSLFEYTVRQLHNIGDDLANGDVSAARLIARAPDESAVQSWLAQELRLRMQGVASIVREEEVHARKRPDIRVHRPNVSGPVSIEIKIADRYSSLAAFKRVLRSQLVGQYMRDRRCHYGVLVLVFTDRRRNWRSDSQSLDAAGLLEELKSEAGRLRAEQREIAGLDICSIPCCSDAAETSGVSRS